MPRSKSAAAQHRRKRKTLKSAKGFRGGRSKLYRTAKETVRKSMQYSYRDRRARKREFRKLWISRINAAARENDLNYSRFINGLKKADVDINRKMLAEIALNDREGFSELVEIARKAL
jgi:large subunit ribosomal protein L20